MHVYEGSLPSLSPIPNTMTHPMQITELRDNMERLNLTKKDLALIEHDFTNARDDVLRWIRHVGEVSLFLDSEL